MGEQLVGHVVGLWRYPVKSMAAEALDEVEVSWNGLTGDRRWAFVRPGEQASGFPWLTIRQCPEMTGYVPTYAGPDGDGTTVRTPSGAVLDVLDPALAAELGDGVRVLRQDRGVYDEMPLSLVSTSTLTALGGTLGRELSPLRFRPNLLVEPVVGGTSPEDGWVGAELALGSAVMRVDQPDQRCMMVNVDPVTGERDPEVLRAVARDRAVLLGVYGSTVRPGTVRVGDEVRLSG